MKRQNREPRSIPEPRAVEMKPPDYQPSKAEIEEEFDMPGLSESEAFEAFFRPIRPVSGNQGSG